jgi:hypothetical protein
MFTAGLIVESNLQLAAALFDRLTAGLDLAQFIVRHITFMFSFQSTLARLGLKSSPRRTVVVSASQLYSHVFQLCLLSQSSCRCFQGHIIRRVHFSTCGHRLPDKIRMKKVPIGFGHVIVSIVSVDVSRKNDSF